MSFPNQCLNSQQQPGRGLFGNQNDNNTGSTSLFGQSVASNTRPQGGLFGQTNTQHGSLFGKPSNNTFGRLSEATTSSGGGLFDNGNSNKLSGFGGVATSKNNNNSGSLFGNTSSTRQNSTPGLFGNSLGGNNRGLFGNTDANQNLESSTQNQGLFPKPVPNNNSGFGFGNASHANPAASSLFGNVLSQNNTAGSLFGNSNTGALFGNTNTGGFGSRNAANANTTLFNNTPSQQSQPSQSIFGNQPQVGSDTEQVVKHSCICGFCRATYDYEQGTGTAQGFVSVSEEEPNGSTSAYQSVTCMPVYKNFSPEELRLVDYSQGRRFEPPSSNSAASSTLIRDVSPHLAPYCTCHSELASKDAEIKRLKLKITGLKAVISQKANTISLLNTAHAMNMNMTDVINLPTQKTIEAQLDSQTQRMQDIESQLEKVTDLLGKSGLSGIRLNATSTTELTQSNATKDMKESFASGISSLDNVIFTPGSSTDTSPAPDENTEDFVNVPDQAGGHKASSAVSEETITISSIFTKQAFRATPAEARTAFETWCLPENHNLSRQAQEVWWHLRNYYYPTSKGEIHGRAASWIAPNLNMPVKQVYRACEELINAGLAKTTMNEDTFTVTGAAKPLCTL